MSQIKELRSLTGLRGVAAVYVVVHHYAQSPRTILAHGYLSVDMFFVLSGFVMALNYAPLFETGWSAKAFLTFLGRRIARVYPLYLACTLCALGLILTGWLRWFSPQSLTAAVPLNLAMIQSWGFGDSLDGPGWSISAEWAAYLLFPAALWLGFKGSALRTKVTGVLAAGWILALCCLRARLLHDQSGSLIEFHDAAFALPVLRCLPEFTLGIVAAKVMTQHDGRWLYTRAYATEVITGCIFVLACFLRTDFIIVMLFPLLILCLSSTDSAVKRRLSGKLCHRLGILSYSIYLIHELLAGLMTRIHHLVDVRGLPHGETYAATVAIPLTYGLAILAYELIEKPGRDVLRTLFEGPRRSVPVADLSSSVGS